MDLSSVRVVEKEQLLPKVGQSEEEREAKEEDMARRLAYIEIYAKQEAEKEKETAKHKKDHDKFVGIFRDVNETK